MATKAEGRIEHVAAVDLRTAVDSGGPKKGGLGGCCDIHNFMFYCFHGNKMIKMMFIVNGLS